MAFTPNHFTTRLFKVRIIAESLSIGKCKIENLVGNNLELLHLNGRGVKGKT